MSCKISNPFGFLIKNGLKNSYICKCVRDSKVLEDG